MAVILKNFAGTSLSSGISDVALTIPVIDASVLPSLSGGDYFYLTLQDTLDSNVREIVKVTDITGNNLTVVRAQEGTVATAFNSGSYAEQRVTAQTLIDAFLTLANAESTFAKVGSTNTFAGVQTFASKSIHNAVHFNVNYDDGSTFQWAIKHSVNSDELKLILVNGSDEIQSTPIKFNQDGNIYASAEIYASGNSRVYHQNYKPSYAVADISGLASALDGKVDDSQVQKDVPANAVFTDTIYTHPTGDGDLHVPATGVNNDGKFLQAGATAGSLQWATIDTGIGTTGDQSRTGNLEVSATDISGAYNTSALEIREVGLVGDTQTVDAYAPALSLHWKDRFHAQVALQNDAIHFRDGVTHATDVSLYAGDIYSWGSRVFTQDYDPSRVVGVDNNVLRIVNPTGGARLNGSASTGAIKIETPSDFTQSRMLKLTIDIYEFGAVTHHDIDLSGYILSTTGVWNSGMATLSGNKAKQLPVKFGKENGKACIWLGDETTQWGGNCGVAVKEVMVFYGVPSATVWKSGWNVTFANTTFEREDVTTTVKNLLEHSLPKFGTQFYAEAQANGYMMYANSPTSGWARSLKFKNLDTDTTFAEYGVFGSNSDTINYMYMTADGTGNTSANALRVYPDKVQWGDNPLIQGVNGAKQVEIVNAFPQSPTVGVLYIKIP